MISLPGQVTLQVAEVVDEPHCLTVAMSADHDLIETDYVWENQRFYPVVGWSSQLLPTDRRTCTCRLSVPLPSMAVVFVVVTLAHF